jgi:hypothetical protein
MKALKKAFRRKAKTGDKSGDVVAVGATAAIDADNVSDSEQESPTIARALSELTNATATLQDHYMDFVKTNNQYLRVDEDVCKAIAKAGKEKDIKRSAELFGKEIKSAIQVRERERDLSKTRWLGRLGNFMSKVYPVARLSLRLTSAVADVATLSMFADLRELGLSHYKQRRMAWGSFYK